MNNGPAVQRTRNDYVLVRVIDHAQTPTGIALPTTAIQGKEFVVEKVGDAVKDLKAGERVLMIGKEGEDWARIPGDNNLLLIKEPNIVLVYEADAQAA